MPTARNGRTTKRCGPVQVFRITAIVVHGLSRLGCQHCLDRAAGTLIGTAGLTESRGRKHRVRAAGPRKRTSLSAGRGVIIGIFLLFGWGGLISFIRLRRRYGFAFVTPLLWG